MRFTWQLRGHRTQSASFSKPNLTRRANSPHCHSSRYTGWKFLRLTAVGRSSICLPLALVPLLRSPFALDPSALYVATVSNIHTHDFPWSDKQRHLNAQAIVKGCIFPGAILL